MKSGQMFGRIFIYVIALIVMAMIFVYGYSAVKSILGKGEQVLFIQMKTNIESAIEDVSADLGRVDKKVLQIPGNYDKVCFVDLGTETDPASPAVFPQTELIGVQPIVHDSWASKTKKNMFLIHGTSISPLYIGDIKIEIDDGGTIYHYLCINAPRGQIILRLEGVADGRVLLDEWQD